MKDSFKYAYLILNDIFSEEMKFSLIEPKSMTKEIFKAQPIIGGTFEVESHYLDHFKSPENID